MLLTVAPTAVPGNRVRVLEQGQLHWQARAATTGEKPFTSRNGLMLQPETQGEKLGTKYVLLQLLQGSFFPDTEIANKAACCIRKALPARGESMSSGAENSYVSYS